MTNQPETLADLTACDREPIHIPGRIQPFGLMAVIRPDDFRVVQVSENAEAVSGQTVAAWLEQDLAELIGQACADQLREALAADTLHAMNPVTLQLFGRRFHAFFHQQQSFLIGEFERVDDREPSMTGYWLEGELPFAEIYRCQDNTTLCELLCREVRRITGFDRVMAYYFDEDWHGMVLAEEKNEVYPETYLNHHFPASDIPAQARRLFTLNRLRMIPDVNYRPAPLVPAVNPDTDIPL